MSIDQDIRSIVSRVIKVPEGEIDPNADLFKDLGIDSLLGVEIFATLDKKYGIDLPEKKIAKIRTLSDVIALVKEKAGE